MTGPVDRKLPILPRSYFHQQKLQGLGKANTHKLPKVIARQWEREQVRSKSQTKDASKTSASSAGPAITAMDPIPTPTNPAQTTQPPTTTATMTAQPPTSLPQVPTQPQALPTFPMVIHPHPITSFTPFPGFTQDVQPYQQISNGYVSPMFIQNPILYGSFGPGLSFPPYPQNLHQHYSTTRLYQPSQDNWFSISAPPHPIPSTSHPTHNHWGQGVVAWAGTSQVHHKDMRCTRWVFAWYFVHVLVMYL